MGGALSAARDCLLNVSGSESKEEPEVEAYAPNPNNPTATFTVSGGVNGTFSAEIFLDRVPITASNFIDLANSGFYNGIHFHRVIPGFMLQHGCPHARRAHELSAGTGGPKDGTFKNLVTGGTESRSNGGNIVDEFISEDSNEAGTLSMANTGEPNTGGSQYFLNVADNESLDWFTGGESQHPVFGRVITNFELCVRISRGETSDDDPKRPIKMESIVISGLPTQ